MESIDSNTTKNIIIMELCGPFVVVVGIFFEEVFIPFVLLSVTGSNSSNPKPAELATVGAASFGASQNFANRFGSCQSDSSLERRR